MQFDSISEALSMGGHGGYVWFIYISATLVVAWMLISPVLRSRSALARARGQARRERHMQQQEGADAPGS
jgi:heme exporter protein CcmD